MKSFKHLGINNANPVHTQTKFIKSKRRKHFLKSEQSISKSIPPIYKQDNTELSSGLYPRNAYWFNIQIAINAIYYINKLK